MKQERGALVLLGSLGGGGCLDGLAAGGAALTESLRKPMGSNRDTALVLDENGRFFISRPEGGDMLAEAQAALQWMRRHFDWVCVAGSGSMAWLALALAAQLPVERLALCHEERPALRSRELARIAAFARRNLSLIAAEILLVDVPEAQARLERRVSRHCEIRRTEGRLPGLIKLLEEWR